jgi:hypothetical protein
MFINRERLYAHPVESLPRKCTTLLPYSQRFYHIYKIKIKKLSVVIIIIIIIITTLQLKVITNVSYTKAH